MKNIAFLIMAGCWGYSFSTYARETYVDAAHQQRQRSGPVRKSQDPDEMLRRFKQATPAAELQKLQAMAKKILEDEKRQQEERITTAVNRIVAY
ncbi:MAG: hypothetical protein JSS34_08855 [Proteobacteria bacterium]|nr:hypothetical protein [Pseudomonadota bacterium]